MNYHRTYQENEFVSVIDDLKWFRGSTISISFEFYRSDGSSIDLTMGLKPVWQLCPFFTYNNPVIIKDLLVNASNKHIATLYLTSTETEHLDAERYTHQLILQTEGAHPIIYRGAQGYITMIPNVRNI